MATLQYLVKAVFLAAFLASYLGWAMIDLPELATDKSLRKKYNKINDLLVKHAPWDDSYELNMLVASRLLDKEQSKKGKFFKKKSQKLIKSLQQFLAFDIAFQPEMLCTKEAAAILKANVLSIEETESSKTRRKRINMIVMDAADRYMTNCVNKYGRLFIDIDLNMDEGLKEFLKHFVQPILSSVIWSSENQVFDETKIVGPARHFGFAVLAMRILAAEDPDSKYLAPVLDESIDEYVIDEHKIGRLYADYIIANCLQLTGLTRDLFAQIQQDDFVKDRVMASLNIKMDYDKFRLCDYLTREHDFLPSLINYLKGPKVEKTVSRRPPIFDEIVEE